MEMAIKVGDVVTWSSQAGGYTATKTGTVIALAPKGENAWTLTPRGTSRSRLMAQAVSIFDRWLIRVEQPGRATAKFYAVPTTREILKAT